MSNAVIGLFAGLGVAAYIYNLMYKNTGGNTQTALIVAGVAGGFVWVLLLVLLNMFSN